MAHQEEYKNKLANIKKYSAQFSEWLPPLLAFVSILFVWQISIHQFEIPHYILPEPINIAEEISTRASSLLNHLRWTMTSAVGGFFIGSGFAFLTAVIFVHVRLVERSMYPWAIVLQTVPIVAIAPLLTIWLGFGIAPKMVIAAIICFFPMLINSIKGLRSVHPQAMELMRILSASPVNVLVRLRLPSSLPFLFSGLKVSSTLSVAGAIVGEFTGADFGIGKVILLASYMQNTKLLFAGLTYSSVAAVLFFLLVLLVEKFVLRWPGARQKNR
jgi:NitT/TauT family transport system permease protein